MFPFPFLDTISYTEKMFYGKIISIKKIYFLHLGLGLGSGFRSTYFILRQSSFMHINNRSTCPETTELYILRLPFRITQQASTHPALPYLILSNSTQEQKTISAYIVWKIFRKCRLKLIRRVQHTKYLTVTSAATLFTLSTTQQRLFYALMLRTTFWWS